MALRKHTHSQNLLADAKVAQKSFAKSIEYRFFEITKRKLPRNSSLSKLIMKKYGRIPSFELENLLSKVDDYCQYPPFSYEQTTIHSMYYSYDPRLDFFIEAIDSFAVKIELYKLQITYQLGRPNHWLHCNFKKFSVYGYLLHDDKNQKYIYEIFEIDPFPQEFYSIDMTKNEKRLKSTQHKHFLGCDFSLQKIQKILLYILKNLKINSINELIMKSPFGLPDITLRTSDSEEDIKKSITKFYRAFEAV